MMSSICFICANTSTRCRVPPPPAAAQRGGVLVAVLGPAVAALRANARVSEDLLQRRELGREHGVVQRAPLRRELRAHRRVLGPPRCQHHLGVVCQLPQILQRLEDVPGHRAALAAAAARRGLDLARHPARRRLPLHELVVQPRLERGEAAVEVLDDLGREVREHRGLGAPQHERQHLRTHRAAAASAPGSPPFVAYKGGQGGAGRA